MGAHGLRGDLKVKPYNSNSPHFQLGQKLFLLKDKRYSEYEITRVFPGARGLRLHLKGIEDVDSAKALFKAGLFLPRESFEKLEDGEFYLADLIGFQMKDAENGRVYGRIDSIMETGANDCYFVKNDDGEILVPILEGVMVNIDEERSIVEVNLPEGLLEIYED